MGKKLYRDVSLERLSSPEQLDELINVTSPKAWLALIALGCILISAIVWGFMGSLPAKVNGHGILLNAGGVFYVKHHTPGQVIDVRFNHGDVVNKGDVLARIELPELVADINRLQDTLKEIKDNQGTASSDYIWTEKKVEQLREELDYRSQVVSQIDGRILEMHMNKGSIIQPGEPLVTMERAGGTVKMEAVVYVPAVQGRTIQPGMEAQISPTTVNREEHGFMLGRVSSVSEYPATAQSMLQTLGNENLVSLLAGQGAPLMVRIDLIPDSDTQSGYSWSSPGGPPMLIPSGTIVQSAVITSREKPINKVIPLRDF